LAQLVVEVITGLTRRLQRLIALFDLLTLTEYGFIVRDLPDVPLDIGAGFGQVTLIVVAPPDAVAFFVAGGFEVIGGAFDLF